MSPSSSLAVDPAATSAITFRAYDSSDHRYFIRGRIDTYSDYLLFRIVTKVLSTQDASTIPAEEFFDAMMTHFQNQPGGVPSAIHAVWDDVDPEFVTNLARFNQALLSGVDLATAAGSTFTGRMARKYNYTHVVSGVMDPPLGPAPYRRVSLYFKQ